MGNPFLLQACLRLPAAEVPDPLVLGREYSFAKEGHRLYQLNVPMDLRTSEWQFLGRVIVTEFTVGNGRTTGAFMLVKEFSDAEREVITKTFVSNEEVQEVLQNDSYR